jgi:TusE/DsrC/DsvC family sulfur relay protein
MGECAQHIEIDGRRVTLDGDGYLCRPSDWSEALAERLAAADGLVLGEHHWQVLRFLRDHHARHGGPPRMRALVAAMAPLLGDSGSRSLYRLFPQGPIRQACRYAGLPRPARCL